MSTHERLLSLAARLPAALLPFGAALGLAEVGFLPAVGAGAAALAGYWAAHLLGPWVTWHVAPRNLLLCSAVAFAILTTLLIVAVEQHVLWAAVLLSAGAGVVAPPERHITASPRLDRTAVGAGFLVAVASGFFAALSVPLVAAAFLAVTAVPILVMTRSQPPRNSTTARLYS